jgi:hypothetical protein
MIQTEVFNWTLKCMSRFKMVGKLIAPMDDPLKENE